MPTIKNSDSADTVRRRGAVVVVPHPEDRCREISCRRFLVIRRSAAVIAPRKLCFPGGGIEPGESPEQAAHREFSEEVGGKIRNLRRIWQNVTPWQVGLDWFCAELASSPESLRYNPAEVEEILWITLPGLLADPDTLESNSPFLKKMICGEIS